MPALTIRTDNLKVEAALLSDSALFRLRPDSIKLLRCGKLFKVFVVKATRQNTKDFFRGRIGKGNFVVRAGRNNPFA
jgi:hypothetical protein